MVEVRGKKGLKTDEVDGRILRTIDSDNMRDLRSSTATAVNTITNFASPKSPRRGRANFCKLYIEDTVMTSDRLCTSVETLT